MQVETLLHRQGGLCFYCRKPLPRKDASIEHIIPNSTIGAEGFNNLAACCKSMNSHLQGISPKHKIELLLNHWGGCPCPDPTIVRPPTRPMPPMFTDYGDPGLPYRTERDIGSSEPLTPPDEILALTDQPCGD